MSRSLINEDSNQFGPGTDLVICLLALLMIMVMIVSFLYNSAKKDIKQLETKLGEKKEELVKLKNELGKNEDEGKFKLDIARFDNATFKQKPSKELTNPVETENQVSEIINKYSELSEEYPFIFVIGHANQASKIGEVLTYEERLEFNWGIAGERAAVIANQLQKHLIPEQRKRIIIISTGELDLKNSDDTKALENAFVEVIFGKEWKVQY